MSLSGNECTLSSGNLLKNGRYLIQKPLDRKGNILLYKAKYLSNGSSVMIHEYYPTDLVMRVRASNMLRPVSEEKETAFEEAKTLFNEELATFDRKVGQGSYGLFTDCFSDNGTVYFAVGCNQDEYWPEIMKEVTQLPYTTNHPIIGLWEKALEILLHKTEETPANNAESRQRIDIEAKSSSRSDIESTTRVIQESEREMTSPSLSDYESETQGIDSESQEDFNDIIASLDIFMKKDKDNQQKHNEQINKKEQQETGDEESEDIINTSAEENRYKMIIFFMCVLIVIQIIVFICIYVSRRDASAEPVYNDSTVRFTIENSLEKLYM